MKKLIINTLLFPLSIASIAFYSVNAQNTADENSTLTEKEQKILNKALAGRTAGPATSCINRTQQRKLTYVNDDILIFGRKNAKTIFVNKPAGGCHGAKRHTLVYSRPSTSLCHGDIARVEDLISRTTLGSCAFSKFVPYTKTEKQ